MELLSKAEKERERGRRAHLGKTTPEAASETAPEAAPETAPRTFMTKAGDRATGADEAQIRDLGLCVCTREPLTTIGIHEHQYTESFGEKDERIYKDYRLLFQKYELQKSREYSRYFADEYLAKYHKPYAEAKELGIPFSVFVTAHLREILATVQSFIKARFMVQ